MASMLIVDDDPLMRALSGDVTQSLGDENRAGGAGAFRVTLPIEEAPPKIQAPDA